MLVVTCCTVEDTAEEEALVCSEIFWISCEVRVMRPVASRKVSMEPAISRKLACTVSSKLLKVVTATATSSCDFTSTR